MKQISSTTEQDSATERHQSALEWLFGRINYERNTAIPYSRRQLKLDRMRQLLTRLGSPDAGKPIVHIAGTKGKGSTAKMVASVLDQAGYRTGLYSSPHLERIEERFVVEGKPCEPDELTALVNRLRSVVRTMDSDRSGQGPTFFDITTAMALVYFADRQVDAAVLEVGLGGRLDSTNVCLPTVSVITSISRDHTRQLGETVVEIAREKAGIIKPGVPVISGVTEPAPREVIARIAQDRGSRLLQLERDFGIVSAPSSKGLAALESWRIAGKNRQRIVDLQLGLVGLHQARNAAVALATLAELADQGWSISTDACRRGLAAVRLPARIELFPGKPNVVVDTAHNEASARALREALSSLGSFPKKTLLLAVSRDKDFTSITQILAPAFDRVIVTRYLENPRAVPPERLATVLQEASTAPQPDISVAPAPLDAWGRALAISAAEDLICIAGSFFIAAELRPIVARRLA